MNVDLSNLVLSEFDIVYVLKGVDEVEVELDNAFFNDKHFAEGSLIVNTHTDALEEGPKRSLYDPEIIPQGLLRGYLLYARMNVFPRIKEAHVQIIHEAYAQLSRLRQEGRPGQLVPEGYGIPLSNVESMIRMCEAHARMHLRQEVTMEDVDMAKKVLVDTHASSLGFWEKVAMMGLQQFRGRKYWDWEQDHTELFLKLMGDILEEKLQSIKRTELTERREKIELGKMNLLNSRDESTEEIIVEVAELRERCREFAVQPYDVDTFVDSNVFIWWEENYCIRDGLRIASVQR